jgi:small subunit ribosomal protein S3
MIERQFIKQKINEYQIERYISSLFAKTGYSHTEIKRTPLGVKVIVYTTHPGLVVGRKGEQIKALSQTLKKRFKLDNPQVEIGEIENQFLDVNLVADRIASTLERFGSKRFKSVGYRMLENIMEAGALGAEIVVSGKVPSARARKWRFKVGYLKKCGDIAQNQIKKAIVSANLKTGTVGIQVSIMTPDIVLPDKMVVYEIDKEIVVEEEGIENKEEKKKTKKKVKEVKEEKDGSDKEAGTETNE